MSFEKGRCPTKANQVKLGVLMTIVIVISSTPFNSISYTNTSNIDVPYIIQITYKV